MCKTIVFKGWTFPKVSLVIFCGYSLSEVSILVLRPFETLLGNMNQYTKIPKRLYSFLRIKKLLKAQRKILCLFG